MEKIKIGIIGLGNCASALIQGINYYNEKDNADNGGMMHRDIGGYRPEDIQIKLVYDVDKRKVGKDVSDAMFEKPNCTKVFCNNIPKMGITVKMGKILDGIASHMNNYDEDESFRISDVLQPTKEEVVNDIKESQVDMLINYLPVGSEEATKFYVECALEAKVGFINNIPVFIGSNQQWIERFKKAGVPIIGDDIKSQFGATIVHRTLVEMMKKRGITIKRSYQLNTGGNTDFLNMLDRTRLRSKKISKTDAIQSIAQMEFYEKDLHVGPSDYVPWQNDNKVCFIRIEGEQFGYVPMNLELRLSVEDSPNSAGVVIDAIRCCKLALNNGLSGNLLEASSYFCKHPFKQIPDSQAFEMLEAYIERYK